jgi:Galactosyltransferase
MVVGAPSDRTVSLRRDYDMDLSKMPKLHQLYNMAHFPQYMLGIGYAFSWDVVALIASWTMPPHLTWCEDVMVGMWLNIFPITNINRPDLLLNRAMTRRKRVRVILLHYMEERDWPNIADDGTVSLT